MTGKLGALLMMAAVIAGYAMPAQALQSYFINREVRSDNIEMFPKWMGMLERFADENGELDEVCGEELHSPCKLTEWKEFLQGQRKKSTLDQVDAVNRFINKYPYIEDIVNWGVNDYWSTPYDMQRKSGDCEDYAISKYMSLRALGVSSEDMRVEIVQDLNLGGILHAVLIIFVDGQVYVLDNQIKQVLLAADIYHYKPIYSINENHWWRHFMLQ